MSLSTVTHAPPDEVTGGTLTIELIPRDLPRESVGIPDGMTFAIVERSGAGVYVHGFDATVPAGMTPSEYARQLAAERGLTYVEPADHIRLVRTESGWRAERPSYTMRIASEPPRTSRRRS